MTSHAPEKFPAGVRLATANDVGWLWERAKTQRSIFFEPTEDDSERFAELVMHPQSHSFIVDNGALLFLTDVEPGNMGFFNGIVWDESLYRQHKRAKEILAAIFRLLGLQRVSAVVPADNPLARKYVEMMGFKKEAQFRKAIRRPQPLGDPNRRIDMLVFGLLKEEVIVDGVGSRSALHRCWSWCARFWTFKPKRRASKPNPERTRSNAERRANVA